MGNSYAVEKSVLGLKGPFSGPEFRYVCMTVDMLYLQSKSCDVETVAQQSGVSLSRTKKIMDHEDFTEFLLRQNIKLGNNAVLMPEQVLAIRLMTDVTDKRSPGSKLKSLGIPSWKWQTWNKDPYFKRALKKVTDDLMQESWELGRAAVAQQAADGNINHIKYLGELSGQHDPLRRQAMDVEAILREVIELVSQYLTPQQQIEFGGQLSMLLGRQSLTKEIS